MKQLHLKKKCWLLTGWQCEKQKNKHKAATYKAQLYFLS